MRVLVLASILILSILSVSSLTVSALSGAIGSGTTVGDFTITLNPTSIDAKPGQYEVMITVQSAGSFSSPVILSYASPNPGIAAQFGPSNEVTPPPNGQATVNLTVWLPAQIGPTTLTITGITPGLPPRSATLNIQSPATSRCLIATATYGSELSPEVQLLRSFRDNSIMKTRAGSNFMVAFNAWYYSFSPYVANYLSNHWVERTIMKAVLYPLIGILSLSSETFYVASFHPELAALLSGLVASSLIGALYMGLPLSLIRARVSRLRGHKTQRLLEKILFAGVLTGTGGLLFGELLASAPLLMLSASMTVLAALFLSAAATSAAVATKLAKFERRKL